MFKSLFNFFVGKKRRLHLGCGEDYWKGWINIDSNPDVRADMTKNVMEIGSTFEKESVHEIAMIHSLAYLRLWEARDLFKAMLKLLKKHGKLVIETPDLEKCARKALAHPGELEEYLEGVRGIYAFDMEQVDLKVKMMPYAFGWTSWHLKLELEKAGFKNVLVKEPQTHGMKIWRDMRIEAVK